MREQFPQYYRPDEKGEFNTMWEEATFILDTNVLLDLYRYSIATRDRMIEILEWLRDRLWIPHQVAWEYQRERIGVIIEQESHYGTVRDGINKLEKDCEERLDKINRDLGERHLLIDVERIRGILENAYSEIKERIDTWEQEHPKLSEYDSIREQLDDLFDDRIGPSYSEERQAEIEQESKARRDKKIPPGYMDKGFGDLIIWYQIVDYAKQHKTPIVFITRDEKEDWWEIAQGRTIGPRPELIHEMYVKADTTFRMYKPHRFMEYAQPYLESAIQQDVIDEIREVGESQFTSEFIRRAVGHPDISEMYLDAMRQLDTSELPILRHHRLMPTDMTDELYELLRRKAELRDISKVYVDAVKQRDVLESIRRKLKPHGPLGTHLEEQEQTDDLSGEEDDL